MKVELVIFDMDGVVFEGENFWLELHRRFGTEKQGLELADKYLLTDYDSLAAQVAGGLWRGKPAAAYESLVGDRAYQPGVRKVFRRLKRRGLRTAILSSGPYHLALRAQRDLGIDLVRANRLSMVGGRLTGEVEIMVRDHDKRGAGLLVIEHFRTTPARTAFVGDSDADAGLAEIVGLPVAYNTRSDALRRVCHFVLEYGELERLVDILAAADD